MTSIHKAACAGLLAFLVCAPPLSSQDLAPSPIVVIPEAIWAEASLGGTWVTELQITVKTSGTQVMAGFAYGPMLYRGIELATTTADYQTLYYPNILASMQALDPEFDYFGRVGTLLVGSYDGVQPVWAQAMTTNGNYGKTYPGIAFVDAATANVGRNMVIPNIRQSATYRTFVGCANLNAGSAPMSVRFRLMNPTGFTEMGSFTKDFAAIDFKAFNPFAEAGLDAAEITNCWLIIEPLTCTSAGEGDRGLVSFGSIANNFTNDTYALVAIPFL